MTSPLIAYVALISHTTKDGNEFPAWLSSGYHRGRVTNFKDATLFGTEQAAAAAAERRGFKVLRILGLKIALTDGEAVPGVA